jgi:glutamate/tyrosine decarboxylase-like PLP-dependent enzyme
MSSDPSFELNSEGLFRALELLEGRGASGGTSPGLPKSLPDTGLGEREALERLAPDVLGRATYLDAGHAMAHMDPPTPWMTWAVALWNARLNQNLLHPATAPFAREAEACVVEWLAPFFGMNGGHMTAGSSLANLTALWAARDLRGVRKVVAASASHVSVRKAARILGLEYVEAGLDPRHRLDPATLPGDLSDACLVLTAGTTSVGAVDPLDVCGRAGWTHIDAAWAGPLALSGRYRNLLSGIDQADSVAASAHKWLFQPKESALVLFRDTEAAHRTLSFSGAYLAAPNIGVQGSHGAAGTLLLATLLAWGREGMAARIEHCMDKAKQLQAFITDHPGLEGFPDGGTGVIVFRPVSRNVEAFSAALPQGLASQANLNGEAWLRCVSANPNADMEGILAAIDEAGRIAGA